MAKKKTATTTTTEEPKPVARKGKTEEPAKVTKGKAAASTTTEARQTTPRGRKEGLRMPQIRILRALSESGKPMSRSEIITAISQGEKPTSIGFALGARDRTLDEKFEEESGYKSLLQLGFVKEISEAKDTKGAKSEDGKETRPKVSYAISPNGVKALVKAEKELDKD